MDFLPSHLPASVRDAFQYGPLAWPLVVQECIKAGLADANELTDIVFFLHHPERYGKAIEVGEKTLIDEWKAFRALVKPLLSHLPPSDKPSSKQKRHMPIHLFACQYVLKDNLVPDFLDSFSKTWGNREFWVAIGNVYDLIKLIKDRCGEEGYVRLLRLGGHGSVVSFRLGDTYVDLSNIKQIAKQLKPIVPYFKPGHSLVQLDHCNVGQDDGLLKEVSKAFGGVAVIAPWGSQVENEGDPAFEGRRGTICGPDACVWVLDLNQPVGRLLKLVHK